MADAAFNTIAEIQRLRDAGFEQAQAEAITLSIHSGVTGGVATKGDLERVEERLGDEIKLVRKDVVALDTKIDLVKETLEAKIGAVDQKIDSVKDSLEMKIDTAFTTLDTKIDTAFTTLDTKIDSVKDSLETKMEKQSANLGEQIAKGQAVQLRWLIGLFIGFFISLGGLILGALRVLAQSI